MVKKVVSKKVPTGIKGLDEILKGGIVPKNSVLVTGAPGTGKSILGMQFIMNGATDKEKGLYITSEQGAESLRANAATLKLGFNELEKKKKLFILEQPILENGKMVSLSAPLNIIRKEKIKRVVLDSLTLFEYQHPNDILGFRKKVLLFLSNMKKLGVTLIATSERDQGNLDRFQHQAEDYLFDGLVVLAKIRKTSSFERCLFVAKMRGQEHLLDIYPFTINEGGIKVFPKEIPFSLVEKTSKR